MSAWFNLLALQEGKDLILLHHTLHMTYLLLLKGEWGSEDIIGTMGLYRDY